MKQILSNKYFKISVVLILLLSVFFLWRYFFENKTINGYRYRIASDPLWQGLELKDKRINMTTFMNELITYIAKDQGLKFEIYNNGSNTLSAIRSGDYDFLMREADPAEFYKERYLLSDSIYRTGSVLVTRTDEDIVNLGKQGNHILGVSREDTPAIHQLELYPNVQLQLYDQIWNALDDLTKMKIDAVYIDAITAYTNALGPLKGKIKVVGKQITKDSIYLIGLKNRKNEMFIKKFNQGLINAHQSGVYQNLLDKWRIVDTGNDPESQ